jgi:outer membrane biosynthesis protein TonB
MKWHNPTRFLALTGAALLLVMYPFTASRSWACTVSGSSNFSHASQADDTAITVCAKATAVTKAKAKPAPPAKPAPAKPAPAKPAPAKPAPVTQSAPKTIPKVTPKPAPKPTAKPTPKATPKSLVTTKVSNAQARFTPAPVQITTSNQSPEVGEVVLVRVNAVMHFRTASLLGREAEVRFTPTENSWVFGEGAGALGAEVRHSYERSGKYLLSVKVSYLAEYRFAGEAKWQESGTIVVRDSIEISVGQAPESAEVPISGSPNRVLLVAKNCSGRESAFGCSG